MLDYLYTVVVSRIWCSGCEVQSCFFLCGCLSDDVFWNCFSAEADVNSSHFNAYYCSAHKFIALSDCIIKNYSYTVPHFLVISLMRLWLPFQYAECCVLSYLRIVIVQKSCDCSRQSWMENFSAYGTCFLFFLAFSEFHLRSRFFLQTLLLKFSDVKNVTSVLLRVVSKVKFFEKYLTHQFLFMKEVAAKQVRRGRWRCNRRERDSIPCAGNMGIPLWGLWVTGDLLQPRKFNKFW